MIVFSPGLILSRAATDTADLPIILYENLVTLESIVADQEDTDYPASNLANPQTSSVWKSGSAADQYVTITLSGETETDAIGVARHNWGSGLVLVSVEGITAEPGADWEELVGEQYLGDDAPALFVFEEDFYIGLRLKLQPDTVEPQAAVIYAGLSLTVLRSVQPGFQPIKYARERELLSGTSQSGEFIGTIVNFERLAAPLEFRLLDGDWYWEHMQPFVDGAALDPWFLALFPESRPTDVAFCWATNNPMPVVSQYTEEVDISFQLQGLGL